MRFQPCIILVNLLEKYIAVLLEILRQKMLLLQMSEFSILRQGTLEFTEVLAVIFQKLLQILIIYFKMKDRLRQWC